MLLDAYEEFKQTIKAEEKKFVTKYFFVHQTGQWG